MNTFDRELSNTEWIEILLGKGMIAFDLIEEATVHVLFTETNIQPTDIAEGNPVTSWGDDWDFHASGLVVGVQCIWIKGIGRIRGIR